MPESETSEAPNISVDAIKRLADLVEQHGLSELRYEEGDLRVTLRTGAYRPASAAIATAPVVLAVPTADAVSAAGDLTDVEEGNDTGDADSTEGQARVEAPLMGVFYRTSKPGDPPFVEVGDTVEVGQVIGLIEAMKVFSEVPSEVAGIVRAIPAKSGALVQPGDALVVLDVR